jgi:hypothetical protein
MWRCGKHLKCGVAKDKSGSNLEEKIQLKRTRKAGLFGRVQLDYTMFVIKAVCTSLMHGRVKEHNQGNGSGK